MSHRDHPRRLVLSAAVIAALGSSAASYATTIVADDITCYLTDAIKAANTDLAVGGCPAGTMGSDTIEVRPTVGYAAVPTPILSDMDIVGTFGVPTIDNINEAAMFFVGGEGAGGTIAPVVHIANLNLSRAHASGSSGAQGGGGGAGLGGALYIHAGNVTLSHVSFSNNVAVGGGAPTAVPGNQRGNGGGGGMGMSCAGGAGTNDFPNASDGGGFNFGGGGGGGGDIYPSETGGSNGGRGGFTTGGAAGVNGGAPPTPGGFGGGGGGGGGAHDPNLPGQAGAPGGYGGGGGGGGGSRGIGDIGGAGGNGGWGGGGGAGGSGASAGGAGGYGGFGGGAASGGASLGGYGPTGTPGFGGGSGETGNGGGGAGFGGAVFIRTGSLTLSNVSFTGNQALGTAGLGGNGQGKGGAIFALASLAPSNGNADGYPAQLPTVSGCGAAFSGSVANFAGATDTDNADTFGASRAGLLGICDAVFADGFE